MLGHHESALRSPVRVVARYGTTTDPPAPLPLEREAGLAGGGPPDAYAEEFVHYLSAVELAPDGHPCRPRRRLPDGGAKYALETCRALFNYPSTSRIGTQPSLLADVICGLG